MAEHHWTAENIPDLTEKVIIVTGANCGIGFETAKALAGKGAHVILACRNLEKAETAQSQILAEIPAAQTEIMRLDLAVLDSVHQFATTFKANYEHLDILVNNAGLAALHYNTTADGFELCMGVNYLGHFALTSLLLDALEKSAGEKSVGARVVSVSSLGHRQGQMDFDNFLFAGGKGFSLAAAYGSSKLAILLFAYELQRRLKDVDSGVTSVAAHPGLAATNLGRHMKENWKWRLMLQLYGVLGLTQRAAMGALPILRAAVGKDVKGGEYYGPGGFNEFRGYPVVVQSSEDSHNEENARRLWEMSEELTGIAYNLNRGGTQRVTQEEAHCSKF